MASDVTKANQVLLSINGISIPIDTNKNFEKQMQKAFFHIIFMTKEIGGNK